MGKASRNKRQNRIATMGQPTWNQVTRRQARQRRREEIEAHNANLKSIIVDGQPGDEHTVMLIDDFGDRHVGKAAVGEVFSSWVNNEIERDDATHLDEIATFGPPLFTSIWDVQVEVIDLEDNDRSHMVDPLEGTFLMDKMACFEWLVEHGLKSRRGFDVLLALFRRVFPRLDQIPEGSLRKVSSVLLVKKVMGRWISVETPGERGPMNDFFAKHAQHSRVAGAIYKDLLAEQEAAREAAELDAMVALPRQATAHNGWSRAL